MTITISKRAAGQGITEAQVAARWAAGRYCKDAKKVAAVHLDNGRLTGLTIIPGGLRVKIWAADGSAWFYGTI
jgi:hypothetical protein